MLSRRVIFGRLVNYFMAQGFRPIDESIEDGYAKLKSGKEELILRIIDDTYSKDELLSTVIQSAFDAAAGKIAYLALPVEMISKIGDYAFRVHKIGVLVYDEHSVVELVGGAGRRRSERSDANNTLDETRIETMLNSLSTRIAKLEEAIDALNTLDELRRRVEALERMYEQLLRKGIQVEAIPVRAESGDEVEKAKTTKAGQVKTSGEKHQKKREELPSFLQDNPWVSILSEKK